jgi:hypothetical protein
MLARYLMSDASAVCSPVHMLRARVRISSLMIVYCAVVLVTNRLECDLTKRFDKRVVDYGFYRGASYSGQVESLESMYRSIMW